MKPDAFTIPAGQSLRQVRDLLLWGLSQECFSGRSVARYFGADITKDLMATGLIEPYAARSEREVFFQVLWREVEAFGCSEQINRCCSSRCRSSSTSSAGSGSRTHHPGR